MLNNNNNIEKNKEKIYAIRIDFPDGQTLFPTYVSTNEEDWQEQTDNAAEYFKKLYSDYNGIISFTVGDDFLEAGVNNSQSIKSWSEIKNNLY